MIKAPAPLVCLAASLSALAAQPAAAQSRPDQISPADITRCIEGIRLHYELGSHQIKGGNQVNDVTCDTVITITGDEGLTEERIRREGVSIPEVLRRVTIRQDFTTVADNGNRYRLAIRHDYGAQDVTTAIMNVGSTVSFVSSEVDGSNAPVTNVTFRGSAATNPSTQSALQGIQRAPGTNLQVVYGNDGSITGRFNGALSLITPRSADAQFRALITGHAGVLQRNLGRTN